MSGFIHSFRLVYRKMPKPVKKAARFFLKPIHNHQLSHIWRRFCADNHEGWILVCPASLGDFITICSLAKAFKNKYSVDKLTLISRNNWSMISDYFESIDEYRVCQGEVIEAAQYLLYSGLSDPIPRSGIPFIAHPYFAGETVRCLGYKDINLLDLFKIRLNLSQYSNYSPPRSLLAMELDQGKEFLHSRGLRVGKTVLINPLGQTAKSFSWQWWIELANQLRRRGYDILWNYHQPKPHPAEIETSDIPLGMMRAVAVCCGFVISIGCGLDVLLAFDPMKYISLYPRRNKLDELTYFYSLNPALEATDYVTAGTIRNFFPTSTIDTISMDENSSYDEWLSKYL